MSWLHSFRLVSAAATLVAAGLLIWSGDPVQIGFLGLFALVCVLSFVLED
jgi:hypothetical protein